MGAASRDRDDRNSVQLTLRPAQREEEQKKMGGGSHNPEPDQAHEGYVTHIQSRIGSVQKVN